MGGTSEDGVGTERVRISAIFEIFPPRAVFFGFFPSRGGRPWGIFPRPRNIIFFRRGILRRNIFFFPAGPALGHFPAPPQYFFFRIYI